MTRLPHCCPNREMHPNGRCVSRFCVNQERHSEKAPRSLRLPRVAGAFPECRVQNLSHTLKWRNDGVVGERMY